MTNMKFNFRSSISFFFIGGDICSVVLYIILISQETFVMSRV